MALYRPKRILKKDPTVEGNYGKVQPVHYNIEAINLLNDAVEALQGIQESVTTTVTFNHTQLLNLAETPIEVIADSVVGSGNFLIPSIMIYKYTYGGAAYSAVSPYVYFYYNNKVGTGSTLASTQAILTGTISATGFQRVTSISGWSEDFALQEGRGITAKIPQGSNITDGHANNSLEVKITYNLLSI